MNVPGVPVAGGLAVMKEPVRVREIETTIVDIPIRRPHHFAHVTIARNSYLVVRVRTDDGLEGIGEGATPGGPWWSGESVETMHATIRTYLAPLARGRDATRIAALMEKFDRAVAAEWFAKAAVEMALFDLAGKRAGVPISALLGGIVHERLPVTWALAAGDLDADLAEAEEKLALRLHDRFKIKMGSGDPARDTARVATLAQRLRERASIAIDLNNAWDEATARRFLPQLAAAGVTLAEQPVERWNLDGLARLRARLDLSIMADESCASPQDALELAKRGAVDVVAIKLPKSGGYLRAIAVHAIAAAAGIGWYGGATLESGIGTAANLQLCAALRAPTFGCELFGPLWLADDVITEPLDYAEYTVGVPQRPGLGIALDEEKIAHYARD